MLFILIYSISSEYVLDLTGILIPGNLILSIYPLDIIKVKIPKGLGTFFSNWKTNKGLKLDVEAENSDGNIIKYSTFDSYIELYGIIFQTRDYYLKFFNDGDQVFQVPMMFSYNLFLQKDDFYDYYSYKQVKKSNYFDTLMSPFILSDSEIFTANIAYLVAGVIIILVMAAILGIRCPYYRCCQCCRN